MIQVDGYRPTSRRRSHTRSYTTTFIRQGVMRANDVLHVVTDVNIIYGRPVY